MLRVRHLRKEYDGQVALVNLDLHVPAGEVYGLIGPNGAGKTTLIRILATLLEPTYGQVEIDGVDVLAHPLEVHPRIGYMSDFFSLYDHMLVWEYLDHFAACYGIPRLRRAQLIDEALELVSLVVRRDAEIKTLSRGMRQRLCFAKTLLHEPKVLLLDEPASGLDPAGRLEFRELLKKLHEMGRTIVISSHILTEMTDFCTSIGILEQGRLLASGRIDDILRRIEPGLELEIETLDGSSRVEQALRGWPGVEGLRVEPGGAVVCRWHAPREELAALHRALVAQGVAVVSFVARRSNLEDIYMRISRHRTS